MTKKEEFCTVACTASEKPQAYFLLEIIQGSETLLGFLFAPLIYSLRCYAAAALLSILELQKPVGAIKCRIAVLQSCRHCSLGHSVKEWHSLHSPGHTTCQRRSGEEPISLLQPVRSNRYIHLVNWDVPFAHIPVSTLRALQQVCLRARRGALELDPARMALITPPQSQWSPACAQSKHKFQPAPTNSSPKLARGRLKTVRWSTCIHRSCSSPLRRGSVRAATVSDADTLESGSAEDYNQAMHRYVSDG